MKFGRMQTTISIPEDISVKVDNNKLTVKGKLGEITKDFAHTEIELDIIENNIRLALYFPRKKHKALLGTVRAHINNMIEGCTYGYKYFLKIVYSHFPIRVSPDMKNSKVKIENLYGGRSPRYATVLPGVKVSVENEDVVVEGIDKEAVGQTAANIQELTRQRGKRRQSPKTFMDGLYVYNRQNQIEQE